MRRTAQRGLFLLKLKQVPNENKKGNQFKGPFSAITEGLAFWGMIRPFYVCSRFETLIVLELF